MRHSIPDVGDDLVPDADTIRGIVPVGYNDEPGFRTREDEP